MPSPRSTGTACRSRLARTTTREAISNIRLNAIWLGQIYGREGSCGGDHSNTADRTPNLNGVQLHRAAGCLTVLALQVDEHAPALQPPGNSARAPLFTNSSCSRGLESRDRGRQPSALPTP